MSYYPSDAPAHNELEISVFGPGIGECVVVHLGEGSWIVIDSCLDEQTGNPVALDYLNALGVRVETDVKMLIVSHWHDDHTRGATRILEAAGAAQFVCSSALGRKEFTTFLEASSRSHMQPSGVDELRQIFDMCLVPPSGRLQWAAENQRLLRAGGSEVHALSPASATLTRALQGFGIVPGQAKRRAVNPGPNELSVVVWIERGDTNILLGGDLETTKDPNRGWNAVVSSTSRPNGTAQLFKVPHHGSPNADHPDLWPGMLTNDPIAVIAPYSGGARPLPHADDLDRIARRTSNLWITAPPAGQKPAPRKREVDKVAGMVTRSRRVASGKMGHVRVRIKDNVASQDVVAFGRAYRR